MQHKSLYAVGAIAAAMLMLAGCGQQKTANHHGAQNSSSQLAKQSDKQSSQLWNKEKDEQLSDFINQWAPSMGQSYSKYNGHHDLRTKAGMHYPSGLNKTTVNGSDSSIGWAPTGKGKYDYNVVALYNYNRPGNAATHITYAFAFHDGQPVALVDESTNGTPNWTPTKNTDVATNFARIAEGHTSSTTSSQSGNKTTAVNDQTVGVMAALLQDPDWFKDGINNDGMYYGSNDQDGDDVKGFSYITSNGDPTSYIYFNQNGDNITIKQWTAEGADCVADGHFETKTVSLQQLENDYYSNSSKRSEVNNYVGKLKPIAEAND